MMKEIEVLVEIKDNIDKVREVLNKFKYGGIKEVIDEYYYDPKRDSLKPDNDSQLNQCLRLRNKNNEYYITYKDDVFDNGVWLYSNEYETRVENNEVMREIFNKLGFKKLLEINNKKETYYYEDYEIVIEDVLDLGIFMEVEYCTNKDVDVKEIKIQIQKFIDSLGIEVSDELNMGKPEMYLRRNHMEVIND